jgi:hypothetical protein
MRTSGSAASMPLTCAPRLVAHTLAPPAPQLRVLATSREALGIGDSVRMIELRTALGSTPKEFGNRLVDSI